MRRSEFIWAIATVIVLIGIGLFLHLSSAGPPAEAVCGQPQSGEAGRQALAACAGPAAPAE